MRALLLTPLLLLLVSLSAAQKATKKKILISASSLFPSHRFIMRELAGELVTRGYHVVWWELGLKEYSTSDWTRNIPLPAGVEERFWKIDVPEKYIRNLYLYNNATVLNSLFSDTVSDINLKAANWLISLRICERALETRKADFDKLVNERFETVVLDDLFNPCGLLHVGLQKSVYVYWSMTHMRTETAWSNQSPSPPSYIPVPGTGYTDELDFWQRSFNLMSYLKSLYIHQRIVLRRLDNLFQKYYPGIADSFTIERNASINLINTPPVFDFPRPYMPRVNFVGGLHCRKAKPLQKDLATFVEAADETNGFMLMSTGFTVRWSKVPDSVIHMFVNAFRAHSNVRFVWQYDGPKIQNLPKNLFVAPWLPQQDLLGHSKCKGYLSHGGLNSVIESMWHGVPIIGIPVLSDHRDNLLRATARDCGFILEKEHVSEKTLVKSFRKIVSNKKYKEETLIFQDLLQDVPYTELNHSAFWVEFIVRHQEVPHARSGADHLNIFQYFLIDVLAFLFCCLFLAVVIIWYIIKFTFKGICFACKAVFRRGPKAGEKKKTE